MRTAALYIRVSTDKQEELSPDAQKRLLLDYAKAHGFLISDKYIYIENGISGKYADKRPKFQEMIGLAKSKQKPFDVILVWKFSRFARNQEESIVYKSLLKKNDIDVISISEPLIEGPFGSLIERIIEWMDEYYSIRLSGEVKRGMTENALRGKRQAKPPFGYKLVNNKLEIDELNRDNVLSIFNSYVYGGKSFYRIAEDLNNKNILSLYGNPFTSRAIKYIIDNPIYCGLVMWGVPEGMRAKRNKIESEGVIVRQGSHEKIIELDLYYLAQARLKREYKYKALPPESQIHWLSSMLKCSSCGRTLVSSGGKVPGFQCSGYKKRQCKVSHYTRASIIENTVICSLLSAISDPDLQYSNFLIEDKSSEIKALKESLTKCTKKEERIMAAYRDGIDTLEEYKQNKLIISNEKNKIIDEINQLKSSMTHNDDKEMKNRIKDVYDIVSNLDSDRSIKNTAIKSIISDIVFNKVAETIEVNYFLS